MNRVDKPWGYYEDIYRAEDVVFKKIVVYSNKRLSAQIHERRGEVWYCTQGSGYFEVSYTTKKAVPGVVLNIPAHTEHRIINHTDQDLVVYETQYGICEEDDIVRLEDDFGRI